VEATLKNIKAYFQGNFRYSLYYSRYFFWLIRKHIYQQIELRISVMDKSCYTSGACKLCGCSTTALQMANKSCDKPCYPTMMSRKEWRAFKAGFIAVDKKTKRIWLYENENKIESFNLEDYVGKSNHRTGEYIGK
jgi:hypothetical protein